MTATTPSNTHRLTDLRTSFFTFFAHSSLFWSITATLYCKRSGLPFLSLTRLSLPYNNPQSCEGNSTLQLGYVPLLFPTYYRTRLNAVGIGLSKNYYYSTLSICWYNSCLLESCKRTYKKCLIYVINERKIRRWGRLSHKWVLGAQSLAINGLPAS